MPDPEKKELPKTAETAAIWVVDAYDQANTGAAIENMGSRGQILNRAVDNLRKILNGYFKRTTLDNAQIAGIRAERARARQEIEDFEKGKDDF